MNLKKCLKTKQNFHRQKGCCKKVQSKNEYYAANETFNRTS